MIKCSTGKQCFATEDLAIEALLDLWSRVDFGAGSAPVTVYDCPDCSQFHFTSKGERHPKLQELLSRKDLRIRRQASDWERKLR